MQLLTITFGRIFELIIKEIKVFLGPLACLHFSGLSLCSMLLQALEKLVEEEEAEAK